MADEVRRSGRANKGHHTKNADALDDLIPKAKPKGKQDKKGGAQAEPTRSQSAHSGDQPQDEEEEDAIYRCVCGDQREIRGREMIMCDNCMAWQHNKCLGLPDSSYWEDKTYLCEQCKPEDHRELLAAIARGEKPWNRKKGSKAAKPKFRHSDIGSEAPSERKETPTPQPTQPKSQAPSATPAALSSAPPAPVPTPDAKPEPTSGPVDAKTTKRPTPKSQPQSPVGEKRSHEALGEKDVSSSKRRKSSTQTQDKGSPPAAPASSIEALPEKRRLIAESLVKQLAGMIDQAATSGKYRVPDGDTPSSIATRMALKMDHAAILHYGPPTDNSSPYSVQYRKIMFNTKKNAALVDRLLNGSLTPEQLATMTAEEMASEDKQKEYAAIKEASERQMVLTEETGPRLRKTHKGEELVGEDNMDAEPVFRPPEPSRFRESMDEGKPEQPPSPQEDGGPVVELPEDIGRNAALAVDTSTAQPEADIRRPSTTFDINSVFDKVGSPVKHEQPHRRQSSIRAQQTPQEGAVDDADIDRLLKDEDNDVEMGGYSTDHSIVWRGGLEMQLGSFEAVARFVAGGDFGQAVPWEQLLPAKLPILGRIDSQKGNSYIKGLGESGCYEVAVLAISPVTPEGQGIFDQLYNYFQPRNRWGVVPTDQLKHDAMRDLYVVPVEAGGGELPPFLDLLEHCAIETIRPAPMLLLTLVAKLPDTPIPPLSSTPHFDRYPSSDVATSQATQPVASVNGQTSAPGPSPSPLTNPHGPQYSPMQNSFPQGAPFGTPTPDPAAPNPNFMHNGFNGNNGIPNPAPPQHHTIPRALEIFGPFIDAPVIIQFLTYDPNMPERIMENLRHIVENVPAARNDINVLRHHLTLRNQQQEQQQQQQGQALQQPQ